MELYIIRHGQTNWNITKQLQGQSDTPLNENGEAMAVEAGKALSKIHFDYCFSSPLCRAQKTAGIILNGTSTKIIVDERLKEMGFGVNEGKLIPDRTPGCNLVFLDPQNYVPAEGAESIEELFARLSSFLKDVILPLSESEPNAKVLISGHGAMDKALMAVMFNRPKAEFWSGAPLENIFIAQIEVSGGGYKLIKDFHDPRTD